MSLISHKITPPGLWNVSHFFWSLCSGTDFHKDFHQRVEQSCRVNKFKMENRPIGNLRIFFSLLSRSPYLSFITSCTCQHTPYSCHKATTEQQQQPFHTKCFYKDALSYNFFFSMYSKFRF